MTERRTPEPDSGPEPTFAEFQAARRVMVWVRVWLAGQGEHVKLSEDPIFSQVVLRSSAVCNPELYESTRLRSAEGDYSHTEKLAALAAKKRRARAAGEV